MAARLLSILLSTASFNLGVATDALDVAMPGQKFLAVQAKAAFISQSSDLGQGLGSSGQPPQEGGSANYNPDLGKPRDTDSDRIYVRWGLNQNAKFKTMHELTIGGYTVVFQEERSTFSEECILWILFAPIVCVIAVLYKNWKTWPVPDNDSAGRSTDELVEWSSGLCSFCDDPMGCFCACCCGWQRWADTISMTGLMQFWPALLLLLGISCLHVIPMWGMHWILQIITACVCTYYRQQIRGLFNMKSGGWTVFEDCLLYCCCCCVPCMISQEARHVELAAKLGHEVTAAQAPLSFGGKPMAGNKAQQVQIPDEEYCP